MAMLDRGNGLDGDITISSNKNLNTEIIAAGRSYADMVSYNVTAIGNNYVTTNATPNGIIAGDKVILISLQGNGTNYANVGNYEIFEVFNVVSSTITFTTAKTKYYGTDSTDATLAIGWNNGHKVMIQRIPQYNNVTITNATITANTYDYSTGKGGIFSLFAKGAITINGTGKIDMTGKGYQTPNRVEDDNSSAGSGPKGQGFETTDPNWAYRTPNNPGGGAGRYNWDGGGAGGGYATQGVSPNCRGTVAIGGSSYGTADLAKLFMGASGASGWHSHWNGGYGGGAILIHASEINCVNSTSKITSDGVKGQDYAGNSAGGGGAGGSILLHVGAVVATSQNITALRGEKGVGFEGTGDYRSGGEGSVGRIAISHPANVTLTGNETSPATYDDGTLTMPYKISGLSTDPGKMRLYRMDTGAFVMEQEIEAGAYNASIGAPSAGPYLAVAIPTNTAKNATVYRDVTAVEEEV
jgi:hypothetical protein